MHLGYKIPFLQFVAVLASIAACRATPSGPDAASYSDGWQHKAGRNYGDYQDDIHFTTTDGRSCEFAFTGEGIEILSEKFHDMGKEEVFLDGVSQGGFPLYQDLLPRLYQIPFFRKMGLAPGRHHIRLVNRGPDGAFCIVDGFNIYGRE